MLYLSYVPCVVFDTNEHCDASAQGKEEAPFMGRCTSDASEHYILDVWEYDTPYVMSGVSHDGSKNHLSSRRSFTKGLSLKKGCPHIMNSGIPQDLVYAEARDGYEEKGNYSINLPSPFKAVEK